MPTATIERQYSSVLFSGMTFFYEKMFSNLKFTSHLIKIY